jgi:hypothetical protein
MPINASRGVFVAKSTPFRDWPPGGNEGCAMRLRERPPNASGHHEISLNTDRRMPETPSFTIHRFNLHVIT